MKTDTPATATHRQPEASTGRRVFTVPLHRGRRGRATGLTTTEPAPPVAPRRDPPRAAQMLALAHEFQGLIDSGEVPDRATLARHLGLTRARVTQILDLLLLATDIQEDILMSEGRALLVTERQVRGLVRSIRWAAQREKWARFHSA